MTKTNVVPISAGRVQPPATLDKQERSLWQQITASLPPGHFAPSDVPLLLAYVTAASLKAEADELVRREGMIVGGKAHPACKIAKLQAGLLASLAVKLKLCPSTRIRADSAKLRKTFTGRRPWDA